MKPTLLLFLTFFTLSCFGQNAPNPETKLVKDKDYNSQYYVLKSDKSIKHGAYTKFGYNGKVIRTGYYKYNQKDSLWTDYIFSGDQLEKKGMYKSDVRVGVWEFYSLDANLEQKYNYDTKELLYDRSMDDNDTARVHIAVDNDTVFDKLDHYALYIGGMMQMMTDIGTKIRYPGDAKENEIQGKVYVSFIVQPDGKITDVEVKKSVHKLLDQEAVRVVSLLQGNFIPARYKGKPVPCRFTFPVNFKLG